MIGDIERIGDHSENLAKLNMKVIDSKLPFSSQAREELSEITEATRLFLNKTLNFLIGETPVNLKKAFVMEDNIDLMVRRMRKHHIKRLNEGVCTVTSGLIFMDMLHNFEKIGDHSINICQQIEEELSI
jgi:phosphate:Na+ symporter